MEADCGVQGPDRWPGLHAMAMLCELNKKCLRLLAGVAQTGAGAIRQSPIYREWELWQRVDNGACERAAGCPVLLCNLNFEYLDWWKRMLRGDARFLTNRTGATPFGESEAQSLLREILMEIWKLGSSPPNPANLLFGLASGVSAEISNLSGRELDRIVVNYAGRLRPRWEENDVFWKNLLSAAIGTDEEALFSVHLHCLQLLGIDLHPGL